MQRSVHTNTYLYLRFNCFFHFLYVSTMYWPISDVSSKPYGDYKDSIPFLVVICTPNGIVKTTQWKSSSRFFNWFKRISSFWVLVRFIQSRSSRTNGKFWWSIWYSLPTSRSFVSIYCMWPKISKNAPKPFFCSFQPSIAICRTYFSFGKSKGGSGLSSLWRKSWIKVRIHQIEVKLWS